MTNVELFKKITAKMADTYEKKNTDYGNSFENTLNKWGYKIAMARIDDKLSRVNTLLNQEAQVKDEAVEDTLMDLATYAIMTLIWLSKQKSDPQNPDGTLCEGWNLSPKAAEATACVSFIPISSAETIADVLYKCNECPKELEYLMGRTVLIKGGLNSNGFPSKKIWGSISRVKPVDDTKVEIFFTNVINSRSQQVGSGTYSSIYPIADLSNYGLDEISVQ